MITLNDYLYSGDTVFKILKKYAHDLQESAVSNQNEVDLIHCRFLMQIMDLLEHNDFLTAQSQKIREFYKYMAKEYPYLSFAFKGRIKSLIRAEAKFNGYVVEYIYDYYEKHATYPSVVELGEKLNCFRDLIAYRIVISMPKCHVKDKKERENQEIKYLYEIANVLKDFLEERGFTAEPAGGVKKSTSELLREEVRPYYRDYITNVDPDGYRSLHITFFDNWKILAIIWAVIPIGNAFVFAKVPIAPLLEDGETGLGLKELLRLKIFWILLIMMICAGASEQAVSQWASAFAEKGLGISKAAGDLAGPMAFAILMGTSRLFYGKYGDRINLDHFMIYSCLLCILSYLGISLFQAPLLNLIACAVCGLSVGIMWPGTFSKASSALPKGGTAMFALLALGGDMGCAGGPTLVGMISDSLGDNLKMGILAGIIFPILLLLGILRCKKGNSLS
jgi:hypothetical protein